MAFLKILFIPLLLLTGLLHPCLLLAQVPVQGNRDLQNEIEQRIENIGENANSENIDYTNLVDALNYFKEHPINLNQTNEEALRDLNLLSDIQVRDILNHVRKNGPMIAIYELQSIRSLEREDIQRILPFVEVSNNIENLNIKPIDLFKKGKHTLDVRTQRVLEEQLGYSPASDSLLSTRPNARYLGDPFKHFVRYRFNYANRVQWSFTGEKDYGEEFFRGSQKKGFDFYSGYVFIKQIKKLKALTIGDFHAQFGQGLTFWTDLGFAKSADIMQAKRSAKGLRGYNSLNENQFMRGIGATYALTPNLDITLLASSKRRDGNVLQADTLMPLGADETTAFQLSGLHRTPGEVADRNAIRENNLAGNLQYAKKGLSVGITAAYLTLDPPLAARSTNYGKYDFNGKKNLNTGIDFSYLYRNFNFYGEGARSLNGGMAGIAGVLMSLDPRFILHIQGRNYQKEYQSVYSRGLGETVGTQNEAGLLSGFNFKILPVFTLSGYYDRFRFPWARYRASGPSEGNDFLVMGDWTPNKKLQITLRYRKRMRMRDSSSEESYFPVLEEQVQQNIRFNLTYSPLPGLRLRNRIDMNAFGTGAAQSRGYLFFQDISFKPQGSRVQVTARYAVFDAPDYNARMFMLETDVPYSFTFSNMNGKGQRMYVILNYEAGKHWEFWLRYAQTWLENTRVMNPGTLNESEGSIRSELKLQARYKF
jgi:hypothetical protein